MKKIYFTIFTMLNPVSESFLRHICQAGISETIFWSSRLRLKMSESQWQDRDWKGLSLNDETKTEKIRFSMLRLGNSIESLADLCLFLISGVGIIYMPWREFCMILDNCLICWFIIYSHTGLTQPSTVGKGLSINYKTETETHDVWVSITRLRLKWSESQWWTET